jgi:hypothetical protein
MAHKKEHHEEHSHSHHAKMAKHHLSELHKMAKGHKHNSKMADGEKEGHKSPMKKEHHAKKHHGK